MHRARSGHLACAPVPYSGVLWREASRVILSDKIRYAGGLREDRTCKGADRVRHERSSC